MNLRSLEMLDPWRPHRCLDVPEAQLDPPRERENIVKLARMKDS